MSDTKSCHGREWQPIETAPTDGTPFLAWCEPAVDRAGYNHPPSSLARLAFVWCSHPNPEQPRGAVWVSADVQAEVYGGSEHTGSWTEYEWTTVYPTRWMPLPEPPRNTRGRQ